MISDVEDPVAQWEKIEKLKVRIESRIDACLVLVAILLTFTRLIQQCLFNGQKG
jgi:hypothetical protein